VEAITYHTPVLLQETIAYLLTSRNGIYVDGTLGGGGHAAALLDGLDDTGRLIGIDRDEDALTAARKRLAMYGNRTTIVKENFKDVGIVLSQYGVKKINGLLLDLGISSYQVDSAARGFSFRQDERLDMRMDGGQALDAERVVNDYDEQSLGGIFRNFGEERNSRRIAGAIVRQRARQRIESTGQLAGLIERAVGGRFLNKTLARVFQAIRIEVNNELENLRHALRDSIEVLESGGRIVVISYHSLEDRIVKETFRAASVNSLRSGHSAIPDLPVTPALKVLTRKPVVPTAEEIHRNPRARSARLRAAEKT
jgi:16S rRNA (cytosine1402-N4)-methyltransferase